VLLFRKLCGRKDQFAVCWHLWFLGRPLKKEEKEIKTEKNTNGKKEA